MKKTSYSEIESFMSDKAARLEKDVNYSGAVRSAEIREKTRNNGTNERAHSPALQIVGAFLAAAIVGGGTFGALKYLEYRGSRISVRQGSQSEQPGTADTNKDTHSDNESFPYDYESLLAECTQVPPDSDPDGFAMVLTGGRIYHNAEIYKYAVTEKTSVDTIETGLFEQDFLYSEKCEFGGDLVIYDNVEGADMEVIRVNVYNGDDRTEFRTADEAASYFRSVTADSEFFVLVEATWDGSGSRLENVGDSYTTYGIAFTLVVKANTQTGESASRFGEVRFIEYYDEYMKFRLSSLTFTDAELPIENGYQSVYKVSSEEADKLGFDVFIYVDRNSAHHGGICVLDKEGGLVMDFKPAYLLLPPTRLLYAGETPSGHQTFFFTATQQLSGPAWSWTNLYACDLVTGQITEIGSTGPNAYGSDTVYTEASLWYSESTGEILYNVYEKTTGSVTGGELTADTMIHSDAIVWDGGKYALRDLPDYEQSAPDPGVNLPEEYLSGGWLKIRSGENDYYPSSLSRKAVVGGTVVSEEFFETIPTEIEYRSGDELAAFNTARQAGYGEWRICKITVDHKKEFSSSAQALEYVRSVVGNGVESVYVEYVITWDAAAIRDPDADRWETTFAFRVINRENVVEGPGEAERISSYVNLVIGDKTLHPELISSTVYRGDKKTVKNYDTTGTLFIINGTEPVSFENGIYSVWHIYKATVTDTDGVHEFDTVEDALKHEVNAEGTAHVEVELAWDTAADKTVFVFGFSLIKEQLSEETTVPGAETDPGKKLPPQIFREWLLTKLQPKMTFEDLCQTVWNIEAGGYQIKNDIRAAQYQQIEYGEDGTFMRYGNEGYDLTCFVENDDAETVREARLILRPGFSGFELPYGLSIDTTPVGALERLGFNAKQIAALEGKSEEEDGFTVSYNTTFVSFTYGFIEDGYSVSMGIEISDGSDDQVYIEIEKL